ncbi:hypothetical protein LBMAG33_1920 [Candidatus Levyibacteriota bacterium]|nr:alpha/beta hydrolase [Candidatus Levybacteria bacterium]MSU25840.1 alpha/beta hydrolase [Candidatus Levybacteria bacterium]GDX61882.1 hypothetical protein LBMAG33_1920 [Candidatus Levybacteria bacterium]
MNKNSLNKKILPIIILHGWGLSTLVYKNIVKILKKRNHRVYVFDFPGFGEEPLGNNRVLSDYVIFLKNYLEKRKIKKCILIGHSFGGRIALKFSIKYPINVDKIILTGVPVIRHNGMKQIIAGIIAFFGKKIICIFPKFLEILFRKLLYRLIGESDYIRAGKLKDLFTNIITEDISGYFRDSIVPIYLIWGESDSITPVSDISIMKKIRPNIKYIIIPNTGHRLPYENSFIFANELENYIL